VKVEYRKRFLKELAKIPTPYRKEIEEFVFENLPNVESIAASGNIEQLKGYHGFYKIRFGAYRIGMRSEGESVILEHVLHRKEIYRYFP